MNWKDKTCEKCVFRVGSDCRRFPPSCYAVVDGIDSSYGDSGFPSVQYSDGVCTPACAEYTEDIFAPTENP